MKYILYFGNFNFSKGFAAVNRAIGNAAVFSKHSFETKIYCSNLPNDINEDPFLSSNHIKLVEKDFDGFANYLRCSFYIDEIKANISNVEAVILYNMPSLPFAKIIKFCKKNKIKVISDVTEWYDCKYINFFLKPVKFFDTLIRMKHLNMKIDSLMTVSTYLENFYKKRDKKVYKVYPIMDYVLSRKVIRNKSNTSRLTFGYFGMNRNGKDEVKQMLDIFKVKLTDYDLLFVGDCPAKLKNHYKSSKNIKFLHRMNNTDLLKKYSEIDFTLLFRKPTRSNNAGFPSKFAESIVCGVPVICNNFSDIKTLQSYTSGAFIINSLEDLSSEDTIKSLTKDGFELQKLQDYFLVKSYISLFRDILN